MISFHKARHLGVQFVRRVIQLSVLVLLAGMVYLSLYAHYRAAHVLDDDTEMVGCRGRILSKIDEHVGSMDDPQKFLDGNKGTVWSMRIGGWDLTDPLAAAEAVAASRTVHVPLLVSMLVPILVTLVLGKVFCSWICPANLLFEVSGKLRKLLRLAELPPAEVEFSRVNKYVLLAIGLLFAAVVGLPIFALMYPPAAISRLIHAWIFGTSLTGILILLGIIALVEVVISPRWWCRTMCPGGALYGLIGWPRLLRVKLNEDRCTKCRKCVPVCEPGLDPVRESYGIECDNCGECVRHCPDRALRYTIGLPTVVRKKEKALGTISATILIALVMIFSTPTVASAHHILGLPHYSYKENYPQAPVLEYPATTGPYDVLLVCYPGKPVPGEQANLVFDIKASDSGQRYDQPVGVRVLQTFTFGSSREIVPPTQVQQVGDVLRKLPTTFPDDGEYVVELTMEVEGQTEVIPFLVIAGDPSATTSIIIAIAAGLLVFLIVVRAIKIKARRRRQRAESDVTEEIIASAG